LQDVTGHTTRQKLELASMDDPATRSCLVLAEVAETPGVALAAPVVAATSVAAAARTNTPARWPF
jgi:hypothetical protein